MVCYTEPSGEAAAARNCLQNVRHKDGQHESSPKVRASTGDGHYD